jgi:hypothetical protein
MRRSSPRASRTGALLAALAVGALAIVPVTTAGSAAAGSTDGSFSATKTVTRSNLDADGKSTTVSSKTVHVTVSQTQNLRGRQDINVSWSGAQPTGGVQPDYNTTAAPNQEYPFAILECRGQDAASTTASKRANPTTCWTHGADSRWVGISYTPFGPWRLDRYATASDRNAIVGRPADADKLCGSDSAATEHWVPFVAADGTSYPYGNNGCAGLPPEDYKFDSSAQLVPPNATFASTAADGTGSVKFDVWSDAENASLGCSATVACTLEIIPIMGTSCDPAGVSPDSHGLSDDDIAGPDFVKRATSICEATGSYQPGELARQSQPVQLSVSGALWWSASNWRNRISVPLSFAPVSNACDQVSSGPSAAVYGSELMNEATAQWGPAFCLDPKLFKFTHVQTAEPLARTLLADPLSGVHAAFGEQPPDGGFPTPTVQAPTAVTGFAISYTIDNDAGGEVTNLRMTPRLLAKLLTQSYPEEDFARFKAGQFPYLANNPINITDDPEFQALNPGISMPHSTPGAATLIALSSNSDVTYALTSYINADPEARAWLNGQPDPWGMVVNKNYKGIALPVSTWPLDDTTLPDFAGQVPCADSDPSPWLTLVSNPTPSLATTTINVQFASPSAKTNCVPLDDQPDSPVQWASPGRMPPGTRFVIGLTSLGEAARYDLNVASLQTTADVPDPSAKFTDATGRTFVAPSQAALKDAASLFAEDKTTNTWTVPYDKFTTTAGANAYPGTLLVYTDVPTKGLAKADAANYAKLLLFAAGSGQTPGTGNGQLPDGYLPMTSANGMTALAAYTGRAASAVENQTGVVPPIVPVPPTPSSSAPTSAKPSTSASHRPTGKHSHSASRVPDGSSTPIVPAGPLPGGVTSSPTASATRSPAHASKSPTASPASSSPVASPTVALAASNARTPSVGTQLASLLMPLLLGAALLGGLIAAGTAFRPQALPPIRRPSRLRLRRPTRRHRG